MTILKHRVSIRTTAKAAQRLDDYKRENPEEIEAEVTAQALFDFFDGKQAQAQKDSVSLAELWLKLRAEGGLTTALYEQADALARKIAGKEAAPHLEKVAA